jgi:adenylate cyclase
MEVWSMTQPYKRKLTAILSADVAGYSRLMGQDDAQTVKTLTGYRAIMAGLVQQHRGRVIDSPGDNILAEFVSVVDAVQCAVAAQNEFRARNAELAEDRSMQFRMGVNLGDVIEEEGRIYGDGVNIAARLEALADPGGICISKTAFDHIETKLPFGYEYLGEQAVKNIAKPVGAYKVLMQPRVTSGKEKTKPERRATDRYKDIVAGAFIVVVIITGGLIWNFSFRQPRIEPASVEKMAYPLPEKPSIAVLAFDNMSGDPAQEFFSDGIAEEIITALSKTDQLFVIARNSTFAYKGKSTSVKQIAEELGVRYVLEGSVRKSENRVRITAQLIDAVKGIHLWAERYDRDLKDIFALQDEITMKIVTALEIKLTEGEQARLLTEKLASIDLKLKSMELLSLWRQGTNESFKRHFQLAREVIEMAPESPLGYRVLGFNYWRLAAMGISPKESLIKAFELGQKALAIDDSDPMSHGLLGSVYLHMRQHEKAIAQGERAVELDPNGAMAHGFLGITLCFSERMDEGVNHLKQSIRLNPFPPYWYYYQLGNCYSLKGHYEEALAEVEKAIQRAPDFTYNYLLLAIIYARMDRQAEAAAAAKKLLELDPDFSVERSSKGWPHKNPAQLKSGVEALLKAGLPK